MNPIQLSDDIMKHSMQENILIINCLRYHFLKGHSVHFCTAKNRMCEFVWWKKQKKKL